MKKLLLSLVAFVFSIGMFAQTIVSTTPENRNAVLEEFTGIYCTYCPDGHAISNTIEAANQGDFFAINIHTGGYATPTGNDPDFTTSFGADIAAQSNLAGYPAGTVNRHYFPGWAQNTSNPGTAMSRGDWQDAVEDSILTKSSYVNLAATADIDLATRTMTVYVEGYFTGSGAPSSMKLNVAVNQNNVEGPQTGGSTNPGQMLPNGNYNHMHMLRHMITGQWGVSIDTTTQGTFFSRTFTYQVPMQINGVPMELPELEVVVFIAEGNQEIITGNMATTNLIIPAGVDVADLEISDLTVIPGLCDNTVTPKVEITNNSDSITVDTFNVSYTLNGGTPVIDQVTAALAPNSTTTHTFQAVNLTASSNTIEFAADFNGVSHLIDLSASNNITSTPTFNIIPSATIGTTYQEDFESYTDYDDVINNAILNNPDGGTCVVLSKDGVNNLSYDIGGYGASAFSFIVNFYGMAAGEYVELMFHKLDFSGTNHGVKFNYAYAQYTTENDQFQVMASTDCGATWTTVWDKSGANLSTTAPVSSGNFFPQANEWAKADVDLSQFDGNSEVILKFVATSAYGNNLFFDDINIYNNTTIGMNEVAENEVSIYPNPVKDVLKIDMNLVSNSNVEYSILNNLGQTVMTENIGTLNSGFQNETVSVSNLSSGVYFVKLTIDNKTTIEKITVK